MEPLPPENPRQENADVDLFRSDDKISHKKIAMGVGIVALVGLIVVISPFVLVLGFFLLYVLLVLIFGPPV